MHKKITVAIAGAPNAGKSTLMNTILGLNISIVTHKAQTTRHNLRGIIHDGDTEMVFLDTPGLFDPKGTLERFICANAVEGVKEADIVCLLFDVNVIKRKEHENILKFFKNSNKPIIALITKIDLINKNYLLPMIESLNDLKIFDEIIPISSKKGLNINKFIDITTRYAKQGEWMYAEDDITDQPIKNICEEITRKYTLIFLHQEIPYSIKVETEKWEEDDEYIIIYQAIFVNKESQKIITLGKNGEKIKEIGQKSRLEIAKLTGKKVRLFLYVKVREGWIETI